MRKNNARTVLSKDERRFLVAVSLRMYLMWHRERELEKKIPYGVLQETLGIDRHRLNEILGVVMEMDCGFGTFQHTSMIVNAETGKPGKGHYTRLQEIAERVEEARAQEVDEKSTEKEEVA